MSKYFVEAMDKLSEDTYPHEMSDKVVDRMIGYTSYIRMNLAEDSPDTLEYLDSLIIRLLAVMQMNISVGKKLDLYHELAHDLAAQHIKLSNGEMPTDNLWYPNATLL